MPLFIFANGPVVLGVATATDTEKEGALPPFWIIIHLSRNYSDKFAYRHIAYRRGRVINPQDWTGFESVTEGTDGSGAV